MKIISILLVLLLIGCSPKRQSTEVGKEIYWESYDPESIVSKSEISKSDLYGEWKAMEGAYLVFGEPSSRLMNLNKPKTIEFESKGMRKKLNAKFVDFTIEENQISRMNRTRLELGYINKLTESELTITWKNETNYIRYNYTK